MPDTTFTRRTFVAGAAAGVMSLAIADTVRSAAPTTTAAVETTTGRVRGQRLDGISRFLGVPYGGDSSTFRFQRPRPPQPWAGVRDCFALGLQAPQMEGVLRTGSMDLGADFVKQVRAAGRQGKLVGNEGEDCLVLNVYTPDASPRQKRPVMV